MSRKSRKQTTGCVGAGNGEDAKHLNGAYVKKNIPGQETEITQREYVAYWKERGRERNIILSIGNELGPDQEVFVVRMLEPFRRREEVFFAAPNRIDQMRVLEGATHWYHRVLIKLGILNRTRGTVSLEIGGSKGHDGQGQPKRANNKRRTYRSYPKSPPTKLWSNIPG